MRAAFTGYSLIIQLQCKHKQTQNFNLYSRQQTDQVTNLDPNGIQKNKDRLCCRTHEHC